jgi:hypothetical protein
MLFVSQLTLSSTGKARHGLRGHLRKTVKNKKLGKLLEAYSLILAGECTILSTQLPQVRDMDDTGAFSWSLLILSYLGRVSKILAYISHSYQNLMWGTVNLPLLCSYKTTGVGSQNRQN